MQDFIELSSKKRREKKKKLKQFKEKFKPEEP